jgi:hypothetical protein
MFPYLCYRFSIFNRLVLKEYVYHVQGGGGAGGGHLLQSWTCTMTHPLGLSWKMISFP